MRALLRRVRRRFRKQPTFPLDAIELRHVEGEVAELVRTYFMERSLQGIVDGSRSIRLPHPTKAGMQIKIKGAGLFGGPVRFGTHHNTGPAAPVFDFEGRMMEDVASGHDHAYSGGATFQQAATEYRMAPLIAALGHPVMPCLGYGRIEHNAMSSWFSVHEQEADWENVPQNRPEPNLSMGRLLVELAVRHQVAGTAWYVAGPDDRWVIKDLHPFRLVDPLSMSQLSWVMQVFFGLHTRALTALFVARRLSADGDPGDIQVTPFRSLCPEATVADHDALRWALVAPYMLRPPKHFDPGALMRVLKGNPISVALLEACPPEYERY